MTWRWAGPVPRRGARGAAGEGRGWGRGGGGGEAAGIREIGVHVRVEQILGHLEQKPGSLGRRGPRLDGLEVDDEFVIEGIDGDLAASPTAVMVHVDGDLWIFSILTAAAGGFGAAVALDGCERHQQQIVIDVQRGSLGRVGWPGSVPLCHLHSGREMCLYPVRLT